MLTAGAAAYGACPNERLLTTNQISERQSVSIPDISQLESGANVQMPLNLPIGSDMLQPSLTSADMEIRSVVRRIVWRYISWPRNVTLNNLDIRYQVGNTGEITSINDPSSKIGVTVLSREIRSWGLRTISVFDGYIDLLFDLSRATSSGPYTGILNINVSCNL